LAVDLRPLHAIYRVALDGIGFAQCIEQRRQRRQLAADACPAQRALLEVSALGQHVAAADLAECVRLLDASERHEFLDVILEGALGLRIIDVGEPSQHRRHLGQLVEVGSHQVTLSGRVVVVRSLVCKAFINVRAAAATNAGQVRRSIKRTTKRIGEGSFGK